MKMPRFLKGAVKTAKARKNMAAGTKFLNEAIDESMTSKDLIGCLVIAYEEKWATWSVRRLHGVMCRRRLYEERSQMGL